MLFWLLPDRVVYGLQNRLGVDLAFKLVLWCELMMWGYPIAMLMAIWFF